MNNEDLRLNSKTDKNDFSISQFDKSGRVKPKRQKTQEGKEKPSINQIITSENYTDNMRVLIKPTHNVSLSMLLYFAGIITLFSLLLLTFKRMYLTPVYVIICSISVPCIIIAFMYELNSQTKLKFSKLFLLFFEGITINVIISALFNEFALFNQKFYLISLLECFIEILVSVVLMVIFLRDNKNATYLDSILACCFIGAGFIFAKSVADGFYAMFLNVQVFNGENYTTVGAIINNYEFFSQSVANVIEYVMKNISVYNLTFMLASIINGFALKYFLVDSNGKKNFSAILLIIITFIAYAFTNALSVASFAVVIYTMFAIGLLAYISFMVISFAKRNN